MSSMEIDVAEGAGFSPAEAAWVRHRLDTLTAESATAKERITAHEAACAERYGHILSGQANLQTLMRWVIIGMMLLVMVEITRASLPDVLKALLTVIR
jgi:hypothetical protein